METPATQTHFRKNLDPRYISGEDLQNGLNLGKGLKPEMVVKIIGFEDSEVFDMGQQSKSIKTGLFLATMDGKKLYKPMILNVTNSKTCAKQFGSPYLENWINKPIVLFAQADPRHGYVARFKKYFAPAVNADAAIEKLKSATSIDELVTAWTALTPDEKAVPSVIALKESLKNSFQ